MESPGTAPGSEPRITGAFIAIFPVARSRINIGVGWRLCKREGGHVLCAFRVLYLCIRLATRPIRQSTHENARAICCTGNVGSADVTDQNPALISSNSSIILSRNA